MGCDSVQGDYRVKPAKKQTKRRQAAMLGLGLDGDDGHTRITKGENFVLYGGSQETHECMQETAIKVNEKLDQRGMKLENCPPRELAKIFREIFE